jgi:hypothetical protein
LRLDLRVTRIILLWSILRFGFVSYADCGTAEQVRAEVIESLLGFESAVFHIHAYGGVANWQHRDLSVTGAAAETETQFRNGFGF